MQATRSGALDVRNCAEGKVWSALSAERWTSVTLVALDVDFTPQYTRKVLASLRDGELAETKMDGSLAVWRRIGEYADVIRYVKARSEPSGSRSRRALCLRVWRFIRQSGAPKDADKIACALCVPATEIYTALRTLKSNETIRFLRGRSRKERSAWEAVGTPLQVRIALTRRPTATAISAARISTAPVAKRPLINSIWALGAL